MTHGTRDRSGPAPARDRGETYRISEVAESLPDQLARRRRRYMTMMGLRVLCLLGGVFAVGLQVPLAGLWVALCLVGMVVFPWVAVLVANDRPPRKTSRVPRTGHPNPERALTVTPDSGRTLVGEVVEPGPRQG